MVPALLTILSLPFASQAQTAAPADAKAALVAQLVRSTSEILKTASESHRDPQTTGAAISTTANYVVRAAIAKGLDRRGAGEAVHTVRTDASLNLDPLIIKSLASVQAAYPVLPPEPNTGPPAP